MRLRFSIRTLVITVAVLALCLGVVRWVFLRQTGLYVHAVVNDTTPVADQRVYLNEHYIGSTPFYLTVDKLYSLGFRPKDGHFAEWRSQYIAEDHVVYPSSHGVGTVMRGLVDDEGRPPMLWISAASNGAERFLKGKNEWGEATITLTGPTLYMDSYSSGERLQKLRFCCIPNSRNELTIEHVETNDSADGLRIRVSFPAEFKSHFESEFSCSLVNVDNGHGRRAEFVRFRNDGEEAGGGFVLLELASPKLSSYAYFHVHASNPPLRYGGCHYYGDVWNKTVAIKQTSEH